LKRKIARASRGLAQPRDPELVGGGKPLEAMDQGPQHTRQKRDARVSLSLIKDDYLISLPVPLSLLEFFIQHSLVVSNFGIYQNSARIQMQALI
jgi:hypothetical protein